MTTTTMTSEKSDAQENVDVFFASHSNIHTLFRTIRLFFFCFFFAVVCHLHSSKRCEENEKILKHDFRHGNFDVNFWCRSVDVIEMVEILNSLHHLVMASKWRRRQFYRFENVVVFLFPFHLISVDSQTTSDGNSCEKEKHAMKTYHFRVFSWVETSN